MTSVTPCSRSRASWKARKGRLRSGTTGFARASVRGADASPVRRPESPPGPVARPPLPSRRPGRGLVDQHDRDPVQDRVGLAAGGTDDTRLLEEQIALARWADQDRLQLVVDHGRVSFVAGSVRPRPPWVACWRVVWLRSLKYSSVVASPASSGVAAAQSRRAFARAASSTLFRCSPGLAGPWRAGRVTRARRASRA